AGGIVQFKSGASFTEIVGAAEKSTHPHGASLVRKYGVHRVIADAERIVAFIGISHEPVGCQIEHIQSFFRAYVYFIRGYLAEGAHDIILDGKRPAIVAVDFEGLPVLLPFAKAAIHSAY